MAQWTKRQGAGLVRTLLIGLLVAIVIVMMFLTGVMQGWIGNLSLGLFMFFSQNFWSFAFAMIFIIAIISFCIRTRFNWGGA